jgi:hypothetical protein
MFNVEKFMERMPVDASFFVELSGIFVKEIDNY